MSLADTTAHLNGVHWLFATCPTCEGIGNPRNSNQTCRTCRGYGVLRTTTPRVETQRNGRSETKLDTPATL